MVSWAGSPGAEAEAQCAQPAPHGSHWCNANGNVGPPRSCTRCNAALGGKQGAWKWGTWGNQQVQRLLVARAWATLHGVPAHGQPLWVNARGRTMQQGHGSHAKRQGCCAGTPKDPGNNAWAWRAGAREVQKLQENTCRMHACAKTAGAGGKRHLRRPPPCDCRYLAREQTRGDRAGNAAKDPGGPPR